MERVTWIDHIRLCTRNLLNELMDTVEKEADGMKSLDMSSRLKQATERIRTKLEVIDDFDKYITTCDENNRFVDKTLKPHRRDSLPPHGMPAPVPPLPERKDDYAPPKDGLVGHWPPPYWDGFNPGQFPCECNPGQFPCETDSTYVKPCEWKPAVPGTETYNVMYSDKTSGGMQ